MPKVLRILNRFNLGGPIYNAAYLTRYLSPDFETLLIGGLKEDAEADAAYVVRNMGVEPIIIPEMRRVVRPVDDIMAYRRILNIIEDFKPDIVHTHAAKAGTIGRIAAIRKKVKVIVHTFHGHVFHSYFNPLKTRVFINIEQQLAGRTSGIIALSHKQKQELSETYRIARPEKFTVIPLGFELSRFRENREAKRTEFRAQYNLDEDEIAVGIIGRLTRVKNHRLFLKAVKQVRAESSKKIRAFIIGDGELKQDLIKLCRDINMDYTFSSDGSAPGAAVTFTSWIDQIDGVYPGMDIIAMTSLNEGTPVSLIEAQAAGIPIITTNVGGIEDIVVPNKTALLSRNNDMADFSEKLLHLAENRALRDKMALKGWEQVKQKFHYTRLASDMKKLYTALLSEA